MALNYLLDPMFQIENTAGKPATDGWLEVYIHGTRTKYYCASNFDGTLHPFKIKLDSLGSNIVLADDGQAYDVYAYNRFGSLLMSRYNVQPGKGGSGSGGIVSELEHWLGGYGPSYTPFPGDDMGHTLGISTGRLQGSGEVDYVGDFIDRIETCPYPDGVYDGYIYLKPGLYYVDCIIRYQQDSESLSNTLDEILVYTGYGNANESLAYQFDSTGPEATGNRHNVRVSFVRHVTENEGSILYFAPATPVNWKEAYIQKLQIVKLDGVKGEQGPQGIQGEQGPQGIQGERGPQGIQGPVGPQGEQGPQGIQGPTGPQGPKGADGTVSFDELTPEQIEELRGPAGPTGPQGPKGADGTVSFDELTPEQIEELRGPQGPQGPQGPKGDTGSTGPAGSQGEQGPQGPAGVAGERGPVGPQGPAGPTGSDGADGKSAYEIWLDEGNIGSEQDFLDSLEGEQGPQGVQGPQGPQGPPGEIPFTIPFEAGTGITMEVDSSGDTPKVVISSEGGPVDQTYDPTSTNAQSGEAVAEAVSDKADDFNAGEGLEFTTDGQGNRILQVEGPVDVVAGPGIVIDNPDGNTLRISAAFGETVLWEGTLNTLNSDVSCSESIYNFERIKVFYRLVADNTVQGVGVYEFEPSEISSANFTSFGAFYLISNGWYGWWICRLAVTDSNKIKITKTENSWGNGASPTSSSVDSSTVGYIYKIVGVHRIANN